jgi:hypothetical protein
MATCQGQLRQLRDFLQGGKDGEVNRCNFCRQRLSLLPVSSYDLLLKSRYPQQSPTSYSTYSCCPWRCLTQVAASQCCSFYVILMRRQLESALAYGVGGGGRQLDNQLVRPTFQPFSNHSSIGLEVLYVNSADCFPLIGAII